MIHWQYIKGAYVNNNSQTNKPYTFIDFYGGNDYVNSSTAITQNMLPQIYLATDTNRTNAKSAGYIITSGIAQTFTAGITFNSYLYSNIYYSHDGSTMLDATTAATLKIGNDEDFNIFEFGRNKLSINYSNNLITMSANCTAQAISATTLTASDKCEAVYFNATSDRRAKTDIKPINQSVLPLIINTQLYSFKYKDLDTPSIGIIAQDVQDVDFDGFSLVDNKEATGQDMDYMSIHESKLIYVLWKAVQEQQKEIEELKAQIKKGL